MSKSRTVPSPSIPAPSPSAGNHAACPPETDAPRRGKSLVDAVRPFAEESRITSWWCLGSTLVILTTVLVLAAILPGWPLRLVASVIGGLVLVRTFILYHDFMHGAILRDSRPATAVLGLLGLIMLTPPRYWRHSHNFHHAHVGKPVQPGTGSLPLFTSDVGSFPLMTTRMWQEASTWQRLRYRVSRHPATMLCAYVTVFLVSICLVPLVTNPRRFWDAGLALLAHGGLVALLWYFAGPHVLFFVFWLPFSIAAALGAYLFYIQHNFEHSRILPAEQWSYHQAALESSSYMQLGPIMNWFTGNIGYHHVHHLNSRIPFYRLAEAMAAVPELQVSPATSLRPRDVLLCLRLNLWDAERHRLVSYRAATRSVTVQDTHG
jgi:acyl-lipid omega-6 desaturase (Delta-12 desaturase)